MGDGPWEQNCCNYKHPTATSQRRERSERWRVVGVGLHDRLRNAATSLEPRRARTRELLRLGVGPQTQCEKEAKRWQAAGVGPRGN